MTGSHLMILTTSFFRIREWEFKAYVHFSVSLQWNSTAEIAILGQFLHFFSWKYAWLSFRSTLIQRMTWHWQPYHTNPAMAKTLEFLTCQFVTQGWRKQSLSAPGSFWLLKQPSWRSNFGAAKIGVPTPGPRIGTRPCKQVKSYPRDVGSMRNHALSSLQKNLYRTSPWSPKGREP